METAYVVKLHNYKALAAPQAVFTFEHPNDAATVDNRRYACLRFSASGSALIHGFAGYFDCTLYKDVHVSIHPDTHSPKMMSWFPIYFPLKVRRRVCACCVCTEWHAHRPTSPPSPSCRSRCMWRTASASRCACGGASAPRACGTSGRSRRRPCAASTTPAGAATGWGSRCTVIIRRDTLKSMWCGVCVGGRVPPPAQQCTTNKCSMSGPGRKEEGRHANNGISKQVAGTQGIQRGVNTSCIHTQDVADGAPTQRAGARRGPHGGGAGVAEHVAAGEEGGVARRVHADGAPAVIHQAAQRWRANGC